MFNNLLIATDGSELGDKALAAGLELAKLHKARVTILTATDPVNASIGAGGFGTIDAGPIIVQLEADYAAAAKTLLAKAQATAQAAGVAAETVHQAQQRPSDAILRCVTERGCDTIVMGSHGRRGIGRLLLGSQAAEVLAHASVPVLIIK